MALSESPTPTTDANVGTGGQSDTTGHQDDPKEDAVPGAQGGRPAEGAVQAQQPAAAQPNEHGARQEQQVNFSRLAESYCIPPGGMNYCIPNLISQIYSLHVLFYYNFT